MDELDKLRMTYGFDRVKVLTPIVESRLRSGHEPPRALKVEVPITSNLKAEFTFQIGFPGLSADVVASWTQNPPDDIDGNILIAYTNEQKSTGIKSTLECIEMLREMFSMEKFPLVNEDGEADSEEYEEREKYSDFKDDINENIRGKNEESTHGLLDEMNTNVHTNCVEFVDDSGCHIYCCKICSTVLFDTSQLHEHSAPKFGVNNFKCTSYFLDDPPSWLSLGGEDGDKLYCLKCKTRVGSWSWSGSKCSCEAWITPAFQFVKSFISN